MDVLTELLPPSYTGKGEPIAKDSRRHRQEQNQANAAELTQESVQEERTAESAPDIERRSGEDRRHQQTDRGRWLESRARKDRRASASTVFVKV